MTKTKFAKGRKKKRYYYQCNLCSKFAMQKEFSIRYKPDKIRRCQHCDGDLVLCNRKLEKEAKVFFPSKPRKVRKKHWYHGDYLQSDLWKSIRDRVLVRDGRRCMSCRQKAEVVHHKSYEPDVLAGYRDDLLCSLCHKCHSGIEFSNGKKISLKEANRRLAALLNSPA